MSWSGQLISFCHPHSLLTPCSCKGTQAFVHQGCLEYWLSRSGLSHCELCLYHFPTAHHLRWVRKSFPWSIINEGEESAFDILPRHSFVPFCARRLAGGLAVGLIKNRFSHPTHAPERKYIALDWKLFPVPFEIRLGPKPRHKLIS